jgi:hypothetical protein
MLSLPSLLCLHQSLFGNGSQQCSLLLCSRTYRLATVSHLTHYGKSNCQSQDYQTCCGLRPIFKLNLYGQSPCVTSSLTRRWVGFLRIYLDFIKCVYRTYSMYLIILPFSKYTSPLLVITLHSRSCLYYLILQRQLSNLISRKLDRHQV